VNDPIDIINSRVPIGVRSYFIPALTSSVSWVNDTVKNAIYLKDHEIVAKSAIGYLRNIAAQVAIKRVMKYHLPDTKCKEASNNNRSFYFYEFLAENFMLTISQVNYSRFPKEALYRNMLMSWAEPNLFSVSVDDFEQITPFILVTFGVNNGSLASAQLGIPIDDNGKTKWLGNRYIDLFKEPHLTTAQLPAAIIEEPKVEFLNTISEVLKDGQ